MDGFELKIPPLAVFLLFAAAMWAMSAITPAYPFDPLFRAAVLVVTLAAGALFGIGGLLGFRKAGTTVNPLDPERSSSLVTGGVYRYSRNPMYVALLLVLLALGIYFSNFYALALAVLFVPYMNRFQIRPEERAMVKLFGDEFTVYSERVRRWL